MDILTFTRAKRPELAAFLEACSAKRLSFEGDEPNFHSSQNHIHLWALEYWADSCGWIDLPYRVAFVAEIFRHWRAQMRGLPPYRSAGYRLYVYEDIAPTISVVAETPTGFPYESCCPVEFVGSVAEVMAAFSGRKWRANFQPLPWPLSHERILGAIEANAGSIGQPSADALGVGVGALRQLIEEMGLERKVNAIRKKFHRPPARFRPEMDRPTPIKLFEKRLPPRFR